MKAVKILLTSFLFLGCALIAAEPTALDRNVSYWKSQLDLDEKQTEQVREILHSVAKESRAEREKNRGQRGNRGDREARRAAAEKWAAEKETKIKAILNDVQKTKYEDLLDKLSYYDRRTVDLIQQLNLSDAQAEKMAEIMEKSNDEMQALRENSDGNRREIRKAMAQHRERTDRRVEALLTDGQKNIYESIKKERLERFQRIRERGGRSGGNR